MTSADDGDKLESAEYEVISYSTTGSGDEEGGKYRFENIPAGKYVILAANAGKSNYVAVEFVEVKGSAELDEIIAEKCGVDEDIYKEGRNQAFELYTKIAGDIGSIQQIDTGSYTIEGVLKYNAGAMGLQTVKSKSIFLFKQPLILGAETEIKKDEIVLGITASGADTVKISYSGKDGTLTKTLPETPGDGESNEPENPDHTAFDDVFTFKITRSDLKSGDLEVIVTAQSGAETYQNLITVPLTNEYNIIAVTTSDGAGDYEFKGIPDGDYFILGGNGGKSNSVILESVTVDSDKTGHSVTLIKTNDDSNSNIDKKTMESIFSLYSGLLDLNIEIESADDGNEISGTLYYPGMGGTTTRSNSKMFLLQSPIIAGTEITETGLEGDEKFEINVTVFGTESLEITYTDKDGKNVTETGESPELIEKSDDKYPAGKVYTFSIDKSDLSYGYVSYSIKAVDSEGKECVLIDTFLNSNPNLINVPRKVVVISGYESHNLLLDNLKEKYEGKNVELVSVKTKDVANATPEELEEIRQSMEGADVVTIHMVAMVTWSELSETLFAESEKTRELPIVIFDDNATRAADKDLLEKHPKYVIPTIPKVTDTTQKMNDYRTLISTYWSNSPYHNDNLEQMINMILVDFYGRYDLGEVKAPVELPLKAIYHPELEAAFESDYTEFINWYSSEREITDDSGNVIGTGYMYNENNPTVGIAFYRSYYPSKMDPVDKLIREFESRGVNVIAAYAESPSYYNDEESEFFKPGEINAVLNYRYIGEHRLSTIDMDVPIFNILIMNTLEEWESSSNPLGNGSMKFINQELIGSIDPIAIISTEKINGEDRTVPIPGQTEWMVERVMGQINLQKTDSSNKNVALIYYNHGGGKANIGASYLDVPNSLLNLLDGMENDGYNIDLSKVPDAEILTQTMITQGRNTGSWAPGELEAMVGNVNLNGKGDIYDNGKAVFISKSLYLNWFKEAFLGESFEDTLKDYDQTEQEQLREKQTQLYNDKLKEVEKTWGTAPGDIMVYQNYLVIPYIDVTDETGDGNGRVILTPQPARGAESSIETLYHDTNIPPTHQYIAFYLWLQHKDNQKEQGFGADATVSIGRHGTMEWLPGKQNSLSRYDWPALMAGNIPIVYTYIVDGVGEGIVAKRRGNAVIVDHMTPAIVPVGLYGDYVTLEEQIMYYMEDSGALKEGYKKAIIDIINGNVPAEGIGAGDGSAYYDGIAAQLSAVGKFNEEMTDEEFEEALHELEDKLETLKSASYPAGLHILGQGIKAEYVNDMVFSMMTPSLQNTIGKISSSEKTDDDAYDLMLDVMSQSKPTEELVNDFFGSDVSNFKKDAEKSIDEKQDFIELLDKSREYEYYLTNSQEIKQILKALDGEFIYPKVGGDPITNPQALPTGGNFQTVDQTKIPTEVAWNYAKTLMDEMLVDYYNEHGEFPSTVGFVLWAGETSRTDGIMEAQIMYLLGMKPIWTNGNVDSKNFDTIDDDDFILTVENEGRDEIQVARPRIDVIIEISGTYRDTFPEKVLMLDRAVRAAYTEGEIEITVDGKKQTVKNNIVENTKKLTDMGYDEDVALSRVFGPAADSYGAGLDNVISATDTWSSTDELAEHFISRMGYVYNDKEWGTKPAAYENLFRDQLSNVDATIHSRSSSLYGALDSDDFIQYLGGLNLAVSYMRGGEYPDSYVMNYQDPKGPIIETLQDFVDREIVGKYTNQDWFDSLKEHGYAGAREIEQLFENLMLLKVTNPDLISDEMMTELYQHLLTGENGEWLKESDLNAYSYQSALGHLIQMATKEKDDENNFWNADESILSQMVNDFADSVIEQGVACCHHTCGNLGFNEFIMGQLSALGMDAKKEAYEKLITDAISMTEQTTSKSGGSGFGLATVADGTPAEQQDEQKDEGEDGGGYGTDVGQTPGEVSGYQMTESFLESSVSSIRDFIQNPTFSASSIVAIGMVVLVVGAIFYGSRKKN
ncbi:cobaltochelatase subunit CobN [Methanimicrococcus hacksteinii]|nr:cobaltochelatase subunit CobN [Methanimicrococcus sp. At1]